MGNNIFDNFEEKLTQHNIKLYEEGQKELDAIEDTFHKHTSKYKYLIAMDSFKGSLTSLEAGQTIERALRSKNKSVTTKVLCVADGGEGTVEALSYRKNAEMRSVAVTGPLGETVNATYTVVNHDTAIMEMSQAAGLTLVPEEKRNPLITTTFGVGEMIKHAIKDGCNHIIMGIGGSATNDCGIGMLQALGFEVTDALGNNVCHGANALKDVAYIDGSKVDERILNCKFTIACDVDNPLTGERGCSRIFAAQKGATESMIVDMDSWMEHFVRVAESGQGSLDRTDYSAVHLTPGAGTAGGLGYAFLRFLGGELKSGADIVIEQLEIEDYIKNSSVVIVGEGCLDMQTTMGKIPGRIAELAKRYGRMAVAIAGTVKDMEQLKETGLFDFIIEVDREDMTLEEAMVKENAVANLERTVSRVF